MSDNEDLLGDDLGDHSLADYNLGNEEEEQLLADDYESGASQNVPTSISNYAEAVGMVSSEYSGHGMQYGNQPIQYHLQPDTECVVPNITVEVPNAPLPHHSTYAPYEPPPQVYEPEHAIVPPAIPASPLESPQIVPSEMGPHNGNVDMGESRGRFISERPPGAQRMPQIRDIPDSLDKVVVPRGGYGGGRGRNSWRSPQFAARYHHNQYRRNNMHRGNFKQRGSFPPPQHRPPAAQMRFEIRTEMRPIMQPEMRPEIRLNLRPDMHPEMRPELRPDIRPEIHHDMREIRPDMRPDLHPEMREIRPDMRPEIHPDMREIRPDMRPEIRPDMGPEIRPDMRPEIRPDMRPEIRPDMRPEIRPDMREMHPDMRDIRPEIHNMHEMRPDIHTDMHDIRPDMRENRPDMRDMRPDIREVRPDMREIRPDMREIRPDMREIRPDMREMRPDMREIRPDMREIRPDMREIRPDMREIRLDFRPELHDMRIEIRSDLGPPNRPEGRPDLLSPPRQMGPEMSPERAMLPNMPLEPPFREMDMRHPFPRFQNQFRPHLEEPRPNFNPNIRPNFEPRPMFQYQRPAFRPFGPQIREGVPNIQMPQVTIRHGPPNGPKGPLGTREQEVRMLPLQLPPNLPPGGLAGKKVLINPHFKGNFQPSVDGLPMPAYIPTRISKTPPPLSPTLENKFGPIKDIDDAAERFIAEQRNALARAASRKFVRRSPQRYIENTTIEIENELATRTAGGGGGSAVGGGEAPRHTDDELLRRQEEFISANRAGLRRRMRSPTPPPRRSPSPRRSPERRPRPESSRPAANDEESEYRRRMREQENLRERVLRAKEARRRKNAVALSKQVTDRDRDRLEKEKEPPRHEELKSDKPYQPTSTEHARPDTTRKSPEKVAAVPRIQARDRSPVRKEEVAEVNSTCENLTPPREDLPKPESPERALTPPLPAEKTTTTTRSSSRPERLALDSDDDLDLILDDIDGILSDDDDSGRFKERAKKVEQPPKPKPAVDLRAKLPPKTSADTKKPPRQKIVFHEEKVKEAKRKREKSPPKKTLVSSTRADDTEYIEKRSLKTQTKSKFNTKETKSETNTKDHKTRQRITFDNNEAEKGDQTKQQYSNRRVILQRKANQPTKDSKSVFTRIEVKSDPTKPNPGIFSRAVRTAIGAEKTRIVIKKIEEPQIEYESDSDIDEDMLLEDDSGNVAVVSNLPHGMTDTRLKTLAGNDVQSLNLDKEERSAKITFKTTVAAETFKKKFNNKMVAASRLTVTLR